MIARNNTGMGESITVRKVSFGQGVERIFPLNARVIDHIDVVRTGRVRRAKLYYLRGLRGKAARLREREIKPDTRDRCDPIRWLPKFVAKRRWNENCARGLLTPSPAWTRSAGRAVRPGGGGGRDPLPGAARPRP